MPTHIEGHPNWEAEYQKVQGFPKLYGKIVVKCWLDPEFKKEFMEHPAKVMRDSGIPVPESVVIKYDDSMLPPKPAGLTAEVLTGHNETGPRMMDKISCAGSASSFSCPGCTAACAGSGGC
jgi:hypothetical protein